MTRAGFGEQRLIFRIIYPRTYVRTYNGNERCRQGIYPSLWSFPEK